LKYFRNILQYLGFEKVNKISCEFIVFFYEFFNDKKTPGHKKIVNGYNFL
jgi:hypothetical protein